MIKRELGYKYHWALADYLQRSARHIASKTDVELAYQAGAKAAEYAIEGLNAVMPAIQRDQDNQWYFIPAPLDQIANVERFMPRNFITEDGFGITEAARDYLTPLIAGEDYPPFKNGIPDYKIFEHTLVVKKLPDFDV
jgi:6-phosphofructokinase